MLEWKRCTQTECATVCAIVASVAFCAIASADAGDESRASVKQCEVERTQCRRELENVASSLEQCQSQLGNPVGGAAGTGGTQPACAQEDGHTFILVRASWTTPADVDLHVVDPSGREFLYNTRTHTGSPAVFEEDSTRGPGNEVWLHPQAEEGRYRVCYKLFNHRSASELSVRGSVLWKGGSATIGEVALSNEAEMRLGVEFIVDSQGNVTIDQSRTGRFLETGGCA